MRKFSAFIAIFLLYSTLCLSQQLRFENIGVKQGLSQSAVTTFMQDSRGLLWIGTWDGLNEYDGYSFKKYFKTPGDTNSLYDNSIICLNEDEQRNIWIGTSMGSPVILNSYKGKMKRVTHRWTDAPIERQSGVLSILKLNEFMFNFTNFHIMRIHRKTLQKKTVFYDLSDYGGPAILDRQGRIWIRCLKSIRQLDPVSMLFTKTIPLPSNWSQRLNELLIIGLQQISSDTFLVTTKYEGVFKLDTRSGEFTQLYSPAQYNREELSTAYVARDGMIWLGTNNGLYYKFPGESSTSPMNFSKNIIGDENSLCSNKIYSIFEDRAGIIWIGTDLGISKYVPPRTKFRVVYSGKGSGFPLPGALMFGILEDAFGSVWCGTTQGLLRYNAKDMKFIESYTRLNGKLSSSLISTVYVDHNNQLWLGSKGCIYKLIKTENRFQHVPIPGNTLSLSENILVYCIAEDENGVLWIGTNAGLYAYNPVTGSMRCALLRVKGENGGVYRQLYISPTKDYLWIGTDGAGLIKYSLRDGSFKKYMSNQPPGKSVSVDKIFHVLPISESVFAIATGGGGVQLMYQENGQLRFTDINSNHGLSNNFIYGCMLDEQGALWVCSNGGISKIDIQTKLIRNYTTADGLPSNECMQNGFYFAKSGAAYVATVNGLVQFQPNLMRINPFKPQTVITDFKIYNHSKKSLLQDSIIYIDYSENMFSFSFASMSFEQPERNTYAYQLAGFRDEWIKTNTRNEAYFTNIDPGTYYFRVKSANNEGLWSDQITQIKLVIVPPFWKTTWFRILFIFTLILLATGIVMYVLRRKFQKQIVELKHRHEMEQERQQVRDRIAGDLHDDLASTVSSVGLFLEGAKQKVAGHDAEADRYLLKSGELLHEAEDAISDIVWYVSPKNDTLQSLIARIRLLNSELCDANGLLGITEAKSQFDLNEVRLTEEMRRNIFLVFKEALKNCIKYAHAKTFTISFQYQQDVLDIWICDDGIGLKNKADKPVKGGNGLANMKKRAEEINSTITFSSPAEGGFCIEMQITNLAKI